MRWPAHLLTLDFETYWADDYTLKKMSTEAYVRDPRFKAHGAAIKYNDQGSTWLSAATLPHFLRRVPWGDVALLCQHAQFDGLILSHHYGIAPKLYLDTLSTARMVLPRQRHSLDALARHFDLPPKGGALAPTKNIHDLPHEIEQALGEYSCHDADLTREIFERLKGSVPQQEFMVIDQTIRLFTQPRLVLDKPRARKLLASVIRSKRSAMQRLGVTKKDLLSSDKFAAVLEDRFAIEVEMKFGKNEQIPALAKTDPFMKSLLEHEDPDVQALAATRLKVKSTLEETRLRRLLGMHERGSLAVYLNYAGAHTLRWSGGDSMNWQNLTRGSELRRCIRAPKGYVLVVADKSQIEARILNTLAEQWDVLTQFEKGDPYSAMASTAYGYPVSKKTHPGERQVGKVLELGCFGAGTQVLTDSGVKPLISVTREDKLWDGVEWVSHQGVVCQGLRETIALAGVEITPEHEIFVGDLWRAAETAARNENILSLALATASVNLPLPLSNTLPLEGLIASSFGALAERPRTEFTRTIFRKEKVLAVMPAQKNRQGIIGSATSGMQMSYQRNRIGCGYSTVCPPASSGATTPAQVCSSITGVEVYPYTNRGERTGGAFSRISSRFRAGIIRVLNWIGLTWTEVTNLATCALSLGRKTLRTGVKCTFSSSESLNWKPVYDIALAGPRNRFTIITNKGPLIAHNCGYGMGPPKLRETLRRGALGGPPVIVDLETADKWVRAYRKSHHKVVQFWQQAETAIQLLAGKAEQTPWGPLMIHQGCIWHPNGTRLDYSGLVREDGEWRMRDRYGQLVLNTYGAPVRVYGGLLTENGVQWLSRVNLAEDITAMADTGALERWPLVMTTHDELVCLAPANEGQECLDYMLATMTKRPSWLPRIPLAAEGSFDECYSK